MREIPKPGERYRHFKNKEYQILAVATHSETGEKMVVYQALYGEYGVWVRPLPMFMEEVDRVKYPEAAQRYRFERIAAGPWENSKQQEIRTTRTTHVVNEGVRRSKMSDAATHSWDIPQEEPELHPLVAEFLDQETTEGRLEVLQRMSGKVDKRDLRQSLLLSGYESGRWKRGGRTGRDPSVHPDAAEVRCTAPAVWKVSGCLAEESG